MYEERTTIAAPLLEESVYPWEILSRIRDFILAVGPTLSKDRYEEREEGIWIAKSATIYPSACIEGPVIIEENAVLRHCAFLRGNVIIGEGTVVGNSCEIKNSILFAKCEVPHYNYIGDSILGHHAHFGAGSITSNVRADRKDVAIHASDGDIDTGRYKVGAFVGDYAEIGCNAVLNPGSVIGARSIVYPTTCFRGVLAPDSICTVEMGLKDRTEPGI